MPDFANNAECQICSYWYLKIQEADMTDTMKDINMLSNINAPHVNAEYYTDPAITHGAKSFNGRVVFA